MIATFTDFGLEGPYLGQVKAVLLGLAPGVPVIDLLADAPSFDPRASAYLLAALAPELPAATVVLAVVDPGVGTARLPMVAAIDGRWYVGPDNGLFEPLLRRSAKARTWRIDWRPERLSSSFHGRDLFAPTAARLAAGQGPEAAGCSAVPPPCRPDWPDDLAEVVYVDRYGNAMTGLRAATLPAGARLAAAGRELVRSATFGEVGPGEAFWYANSCGLAEIAVNGGAAATALSLVVGAPVEVR
jgi:S-adenosylmethionine hydrolase